LGGSCEGLYIFMIAQVNTPAKPSFGPYARASVIGPRGEEIGHVRFKPTVEDYESSKRQLID
jgi:hypothetical protein